MICLKSVKKAMINNLLNPEMPGQFALRYINTFSSTSRTKDDTSVMEQSWSCRSTQMKL